MVGAAGGPALLDIAARELRRADRPRLIVVGAAAAADPADAVRDVPLHAIGGPDPVAELLALLQDDGAR